jgi:hypothetical protein
MPTPEQQREYTRLSGLLQEIGMRYMKELPNGSTSLLMKVNDGKVLVEAFDQNGKLIGTVPNEKTSSAFRTALQSTFEHTISPDPDGVGAIISNPMTVRSR